jgi:hypothetical protein
LSISSDCADAYVLLAEAPGSLAKALELYCKGVEAFLPTWASVTKVKRCAADKLNAWQTTAGALVWLTQRIDDKPTLLN